MKYSEYLRFVADKGFDEFAENLELRCDTCYICPTVAYIMDNYKGLEAHSKRLLGEVNRKLRALSKKTGINISTLSTAIGCGTEARKRWLNKLADTHERRGN